MSNIYVFTLQDCLYCHNLKNRLRDEGISFNEVDIEVNHEIWDDVIRQTKDDSVPCVYISKGENSGVIYVPGRDFNSDDEIVKIIHEN